MSVRACSSAQLNRIRPLAQPIAKIESFSWSGTGQGRDCCSAEVPSNNKEPAVHNTRNDLSAKARARVVDLLNARLADAIDLYLQAKQAHWNVKGPGFIELHELFDQVATAVNVHVDELAERITALGGVAEGTVSAVVGRSRLEAYPLDIAEGRAHVDALAEALARFGKLVRRAIDDAAKAGDAGSSDLFTGVSRDIDKHLWLVSQAVLLQFRCGHAPRTIRTKSPCCEALCR